MTKPPIRRLTLADLAILIAASAVALLLLRMVREADGPGQEYFGLPRGYKLYVQASPFLLAYAVALIVARLIGPRPRWRRVLSQPGTIACLMFFFSFTLNTLLELGRGLLNTLLNQPSYYPLLEIRLVLLSSLGGGGIVAASWATLALAGRWRPEPSWIDRSGRLFGIVAILSTVATMSAP